MQDATGAGKGSAGTILITGSAGFIGFHLAQAMLAQGWRVVGVDNHNSYYDPALKAAREARLTPDHRYRAVRGGIEEPGLLARIFAEERPGAVVHLAAQAGVRHSIDNPRAYVQANLIGTFELLEAARACPPRHLLLASTSSAYGANTEMPYRETDKADSQMSFYAATKKSTEAMAHSYAHLFALPITMFRFFTVYGPWGRPDMAPYLFTSAILAGRPIRVFNHGEMRRDFTYIDDIVEGVRRALDVVPEPDPSWSGKEPDPGTSLAPYRLYNIGNHQPVELMHLIRTLEEALGLEAKMEMLPLQPGDVPATFADIEDLARATGFRPHTPIEQGVKRFVHWYRHEWIPIAG